LVPNTEYARLIGVTPRTLFNYDARGGILPPPTIINGRKYRDPDVMPTADAERTPK
jgi:DNA-binding transcriptional MerR regulator